MKGVVNVKNKVNFIKKTSSFTILGDPGCDGLGVEIMTTFAKAMSCTHSDFKIILGDLVPFGLEEFYEYIQGIINEVSRKPVYTLCGNHDTVYYETYFGLRNYILVNDELLIVALDNSKGRFEAETVNFLDESLKEYTRTNILILFHIPPPNSYSSNSMKMEEWQKLKAVMDPYKKNIKLILSGHVHSYFQDDVDGYKVVVSAGGGARLEFFGRLPNKESSFHHVLRFYFDNDSELKYEYVSLAEKSYTREIKNKKIYNYLNEAFQNEAMAHLRYQFFADDAHEKGFMGIEKLFNALSKSAFFHAKNYFSVLNKLHGIGYNLKESRKIEKADLVELYSKYLPYAVKVHLPLTQYAFSETYGAKNNYSGLLPETIKAYHAGKDIESATYFVCTTCGNTGRLDKELEHCPICGAPLDKIIKI
ncbi:MAG: metallophosphoesterase [Thermodesulfobacteriota bacterium]|jgi:rubrerythrin|nr:MAG: metallophosphoesterase [Thermodesulfobacteriota bacterium]